MFKRVVVNIKNISPLLSTGREFAIIFFSEWNNKKIVKFKTFIVLTQYKTVVTSEYTTAFELVTSGTTAAFNHFGHNLSQVTYVTRTLLATDSFPKRLC